MTPKSIDDFIQDLSNIYPSVSAIDYSLAQLRKTKFKTDECFFVWDVRLGEMIFKTGFKNLLGISDEDMTLKTFASLFHQDDEGQIRRIGQAAIRHSINNSDSNSEHSLYISHRIKNSNGEYIKVLAQNTPYSLDDKNLITSFLVKLRDISFIDATDIVQYKFFSGDLIEGDFHKRLYEDTDINFTTRETEIIEEIEKGNTNSQISSNLNISKYTVATHRKNILKKSKCHSVKELLKFCKQNGILK